MRIFAALALVAAITPACGDSFFRQYEYEEEIYLALDGTATVYVNASLAALDALRGASFDTRPNSAFDRAAVARFFSTPVTHVVRVSSSRRAGRRFAHVRLDVADIRRLAEAAPFAWSTYRFGRDTDIYTFQQTVGPSASVNVRDVGWNGSELVAFRLHLPSKIVFHNAGETNYKRGNILVWEQSLTDRRHGVPLTLDAKMETQSILYRTLWLFGATIVAVGLGFCALVWWIVRRPDAARAANASGDPASGAAARGTPPPREV
jgi:hypothetical protein